jgi:hypothetical protein
MLNELEHLEPRVETPKIFGIGFHKTGTKSLAQSLTLLGYSVTGPNEVRNPNFASEVWQTLPRIVRAFDAFQDNPWPIVYRELDRRYCGSKFILTVRQTDQWIRSVCGHFGTNSTPMREWIYGSGKGAPIGNERLYVERYERHNHEVLEYFRNRPQDLLVLRLTDGEGWEKLCPFLSKPVPPVALPHANAAGLRARNVAA